MHDEAACIVETLLPREIVPERRAGHNSGCLLHVARRYYSHGPTPARNILATDGLLIWLLKDYARECIQTSNITTSC
jgi:hypothetical protein